MVPHKATSRNITPVLDGMNMFRKEYETETVSIATARERRRRGISLIQVYPLGPSCHELFDVLCPQCDFVAVGMSVVPGVGNVISATFHRTSQKVLDTKPFVIVENVVPKTVGLYAGHRDDIKFKFVEAWVMMQTEIVSNFTVVHAKKYNGAVVMEEWASRDQFTIDSDINTCQSTPKRQRTLREAYISENHVQLVRMWKGMTAETHSKPYICVSDPCILSFHDMVPPLSQSATSTSRALRHPAVQRQGLDHVGAPQEDRHLPRWRRLWPVSYTHLTLPTIYSV